jgi:hypothetical protein
MKAAVYEGPRTVTVKDVPDAKIEHPCDILVRITTTNICGSDLHMYEGRTSFETGRSMGHENLGEVVEIGSAVSKVKVGDYVVLPFNVACGFCKQCERGLTNYCLTMQPEPALAGAAYPAHRLTPSGKPTGRITAPGRVRRTGQGDRRADGQQGAGKVGRVEEREQNLDPRLQVRIPARRAALAQRCAGTDQGPAVRGGQEAQHRRPFLDDQAAVAERSRPLRG